MEHRIKELDYLKSILILLMVAFHLVYIGDKYPYIHVPHARFPNHIRLFD